MYWNAWTKRNVSSTLRPTGKSFTCENIFNALPFLVKTYSTVICRKFCFPSMMNKPRNEMPDSSCKTPYERATAKDLSAKSGYSIFPKPPSFLGVLIHAKWVKWESVETPITSQAMLRNSCILSENAMISVGQTKVLKAEEMLSLNCCYIVIITKLAWTVITSGEVTLFESKYCAKYWKIMQDSCNLSSVCN